MASVREKAMAGSSKIAMAGKKLYGWLTYNHYGWHDRAWLLGYLVIAVAMLVVGVNRVLTWQEKRRKLRLGR